MLQLQLSTTKRARNLFAFALLLCGCMNTPRDGDVVSSRSSQVSFSALIKESKGQMWFQAASAFDASGLPTQWETVASGDVASSGQFVTRDADDIPWWGMERTVQLQNRHWWRTTGGAHRYKANLRTLYQYDPTASQFPLMMFDSGPATNTCIEDQLRNGGSGGDIMKVCSRGAGLPKYVAVYSTGD